MAQDEARHTEAWLKLMDEAGGEAERDPYLDKLAAMFLALDTLEEKVFLMQVFFERLIIPRFRMIAAASPGTVLEDLCNRLTVDDGIHHSSGWRTSACCSRTRRGRSSSNCEGREPDAADLRPALHVAAESARVDRRAMRDRDIKMLQDDLEQGVRLAGSLGIDVSDLGCRRSRDTL